MKVRLTVFLALLVTIFSAYNANAYNTITLEFLNTCDDSLKITEYDVYFKNEGSFSYPTLLDMELVPGTDPPRYNTLYSQSMMYTPGSGIDLSASAHWIHQTIDLIVSPDLYQTGINGYIWDGYDPYTPYRDITYAPGDGVFYDANLVPMSANGPDPYQPCALDPDTFVFYDQNGAVITPDSISETFSGEDGMDQRIVVDFGSPCCSPVPIPPSALLLFSGLVGLLWSGRKMRRQ